MKIITLTTDQQVQAATLKAAFTSAITAARTARQAYNNYLASVAGVSSRQFQLSDDGKTLVAM